jgi:aspartate kinase
MKIHVNKFGGSILSNHKALLNLSGLLHNDSDKNIVIVSAAGRTSYWLKQAVLSAEISNLNQSEYFLNNIYLLHTNLISNLFNSDIHESCLNNINLIFLQIRKILNNISITGEATAKTLDKVLAFGEDMILSIITTLFTKNKEVSVLDSRDIISTDSNHGNAEIILDITRNNFTNILLPQLANNNLIILQGFIGSDITGNTTTMGFESSNLTAALIAEFVNANVLTYFTDVDGIYNADPKLYSNAQFIDKIDYHTAKIAGRYGLKLIYPEMIDLAENNLMKLVYRNGLEFNDKTTEINSFPKIKTSLVMTQTVKSYKLNDTILSDKLLHGNDILMSSISGLDNFILIKSSLNINDEFESYQLLTIVNPHKEKIINYFFKNLSEYIENGMIVFDSGVKSDVMNVAINDKSNIKAEHIVNELCKLI